MAPNRRYFPFGILAALGLAIIMMLPFSCTKRGVISSFSPLFNFSLTGDSLYLPMNLDGSIFEGVTLPGRKGKEHFVFNAELYNATGEKQKLHYRIYYQNESYKFTEFADSAMHYNPEAAGNFYGSWEDAADGFRSTPEIDRGESFVLTDSFLIRGNPRDEARFIGPPATHQVGDSASLAATIRGIKGSKEWLAHIASKARDLKVSLDEQITREALWVLANPPAEGKENNHWQRNPRAGKYSFLLVVCTDSALARMPDYIRDIRRKNPDSTYVNPYWYFLHGPGSAMENVWTERSHIKLQTSASFNLASGIHVPCLKHPDGLCNTHSYTNSCGDSDELFQHAQFSQLFHHLPPGWKLKNIPVLDDVTSPDYDLAKYQTWKDKYPADKRAETQVQVTRFPCTTAWYDEGKKVLCIKNPGSTTEMRKENAGVMGRIGFTYGKWRAKVKFPDQINQHNMWTGLTHAVWLLYQSEADWNLRGECKPGGFVPNNSPDPATAPRKPQFYYSEIDIEMAHESRYWPKSSYGMRPEMYQTDDPQNSRDAIISCTNWDLCCHSAPYYQIGANPYKPAPGKLYTLHRWGEFVPALTIKSPFPQDSLFGNFAYYEIDWQPERIIWRVGLDPTHMVEVGYMDRSITNIPDNQMVMVVSQEFHYADWWPLAPQSQDDIPYPVKDFVAEIEEITVE